MSDPLQERRHDMNVESKLGGLSIRRRLPSPDGHHERVDLADPAATEKHDLADPAAPELEAPEKKEVGYNKNTMEEDWNDDHHEEDEPAKNKVMASQQAALSVGPVGGKASRTAALFVGKVMASPLNEEDDDSDRDDDDAGVEGEEDAALDEEEEAMMGKGEEEDYGSENDSDDDDSSDESSDDKDEEVMVEAGGIEEDEIAGDDDEEEGMMSDSSDDDPNEDEDEEESDEDDDGEQSDEGEGENLVNFVSSGKAAASKLFGSNVRRPTPRRRRSSHGEKDLIDEDDDDDDDDGDSSSVMSDDSSASSSSSSYALALDVSASKSPRDRDDGDDDVDVSGADYDDDEELENDDDDDDDDSVDSNALDDDSAAEEDVVLDDDEDDDEEASDDDDESSGSEADEDDEEGETPGDRPVGMDLDDDDVEINKRASREEEEDKQDNNDESSPPNIQDGVGAPPPTPPVSQGRKSTSQPEQQGGGEDYPALQRDSLKADTISIEELEDIIKESSSTNGSSESDLEFSDEEEDNDENDSEKLAPHGSDDEVAELLSDALEFDYWDCDRISSAVRTLTAASKDCEQDVRRSKYPIRLPAKEDAAFWVDKMLAAIAPQSPALEYVSSHPWKRHQVAKHLHDAFHAELSSLDLTHVNASLAAAAEDDSNASGDAEPGKENVHLFVGSFEAAESRLTLAALHIKHIILISFHPLDELWTRDGIKYSTHILPPCGDGGNAPVHNEIADAEKEVASALSGGNELMRDQGKSVLVACSTGNEHSCAVGAKYMMRRMGIDKEAAIERMCALHPSSTIDPTWIETPATIAHNQQYSGANEPSPESHKTKRILSCQRLPGLVKDPIMTDYPKRSRLEASDSLDKEDGGKDIFREIPALPSLSIGAAADESTNKTLSMRRFEHQQSSSEDEEVEIDQRLGEELEDRDDRQKDGDNSPIPLLTPPASPLRIVSKEGETTLCEWPSNLAVDSAMAAAKELRPLSPDSLLRQDEDEEKRIQGQKQPPRKLDQTGLTPKLQSIKVSFR